MAALRYIAPVMAVAAGAAAQVCGGTTTIQSAADATDLANSCGSRTFSGDIVIQTSVSEPISLNTITGISGDLIATNVSGITGLSADSITSIGGAFTLKQLTVLTTLSFPMLVKVGSIDWETLPNLAGLSFSEDGVQELDSLRIADTELSSLEGINLQTAETIDITQNGFLQTVSMQIANITSSLMITDNGDKLQAEFPNLIWANNMSFRAVASVKIPSLASVNGSLGFYESSFESLSAPNLTDVGQDLSFVQCDSVTNITMPELTTIEGGFLIANNTELKEITGFPKVESVGGALDFNGVYETVELPALNNVRGAFNLQSTENINDACSHFGDIAGPNKPIKGEFACTQTDDPQGAGSVPDGTNSADGSATSNAAHPILIPGATGLLGVVAAIFGLL